MSRELEKILIILGRRHNQDAKTTKGKEVSRLENWKWPFLRYIAFFDSIFESRLERQSIVES